MDLNLAPLYAVKRGDPDAARSVLGMIAKRLKNGEALPGELTDFVAEAFEQIAAGESADKALGLVRRNKRRPTDLHLFDRDVLLAAAKWLWKEDGMKPKQALKQVAKTYPVSESTVKQAWTQHGWMFESKDK